MEKLTILWTTDNKDTFFNMLAMYATNSVRKAWWDNVTVIIWGASAKLAGIDAQVQSELVQMIATGVTIEACKACADNLGVSGELEKLGVNVHYMGVPLTECLKSGEKFISI
ncbi:hypothetical protein [uncultured Draconibacterium sp.]|uniref:hypothetical protein n=1 Tax=uncultured Draconibacterium sp. TaxID=1573823 RepID=UPI0032180878